MILLSCKFSNFVASRTFMANGLDCRQCTIGRLEPILCRFHNCLNHFKATRLVLVLISPHFSRGLVKSWVARISQWSKDCWAGHHEGTNYLLLREKRGEGGKRKWKWGNRRGKGEGENFWIMNQWENERSGGRWKRGQMEVWWQGVVSRFEYCLLSLTTTCTFWSIQPLSRYYDLSLSSIIKVISGIVICHGHDLQYDVYLHSWLHHSLLVIVAPPFPTSP